MSDSSGLQPDAELVRSEFNAPDDEVLYRHVHPTHWVFDDGAGGYRLSTAFMMIETGDDGLSSYAETLLKERSVAPEDILPGAEYGLASITSGDARGQACDVVFSPDKVLPINFAHMLICLSSADLSRNQRRKLSKALCEFLTILKPPHVADRS
ncbi:hypothetical protein [Umezawaea sp. NPDC059074]|uniref:hypothetical protein n=1 Tax=Umezawaea sp. NPDC059074 TaxID=3346716 RepID=UPI0036C38656